MDPMIGGLANVALGGAIGIGDTMFGNQQQLKQNEKLLKQEMEAQKQMAEFNQALGIDTWKKTNMSAQMAELKKAGLNASLMYGGKGGGGATTQTGGQGVSGAKAQSNQGAIGMGIQNMQALQMNQAQIDLMKAQANKANVEAKKTGGVDTELAKGQLGKLAQEIKSETVKTSILGYQETIEAVRADVMQRTANEQIGTIQEAYNKLKGEAISAQTRGEIDQANADELIKQASLETVKMAVEIEALQAVKNNTLQKTEESKQFVMKLQAEIVRMGEQTAQGWAGLTDADLDRAIKQTIANFQTSTPAQIKQWTDVGESLTRSFNNILRGNKEYGEQKRSWQNEQNLKDWLKY